jgi:glutamyl-Q tRNA(Asp) synthetase
VEKYVGRFAPSPTGALHAGSLVAALASWLDARAHGGRWLLRIEDTDAPRCVPGADREILRQLDALGLQPDEPPLWQSQRGAIYQQALDNLVHRGLAYPCACTRRDIEAALAAQGHEHRRHEERVYPGTCRDGLHGKPARAWRLRCGTDAAPVRIAWHDRRLGALAQDVTHEVGDFVLRRADGIWSYQLAVVVDDALQGITHIVRGEDLTDNTPRQIWLQRQLGAAQPVYLHLPLVLDARGEKLSKQHGAPPLDLTDPLAALRAAAQALQLPVEDAGDVRRWLERAVQAWAGRWAAEACSKR